MTLLHRTYLSSRARSPSFADAVLLLEFIPVEELHMQLRMKRFMSSLFYLFFALCKERLCNFFVNYFEEKVGLLNKKSAKRAMNEKGRRSWKFSLGNGVWRQNTWRKCSTACCRSARSFRWEQWKKNSRTIRDEIVLNATIEGNMWESFRDRSVDHSKKIRDTRRTKINSASSLKTENSNAKCSRRCSLERLIT